MPDVTTTAAYVAEKRQISSLEIIHLIDALMHTNYNWVDSI